MQHVNLTEEQITELYKCYKDPVYFIENYIWIELKETAQIVQFKMFPYQKKILKWLVEGKNILVLKSRRVGMSTVVAAYIAWLLNFRRGVNALLISINEEKARKLLDKVKFNLFNIRKHDSEDFALATDYGWMLNTVAVNNKHFLGIGWLDDAGNIVSLSEVASLTTTDTSGRGDSATFLFIDELAALRADQETLMRSARLTTTKGGQWMAGGCVTKDTYVFTENGIQQLADFINEESEENYFTEIDAVKVAGAFGLKECNLTYNNGIKDALEIVTNLNYSIKCSANHPLLVNRNGTIDWVKSSEIRVGDWIPISRNNGYFGTEKIEHPYLLGLVLGDGYIENSNNHYRITITTADQETVDYLVDNYEFKQEKDKIHIRKNSKELVEYFKSIGYKLVKAPEKTIPKQVLLSDKETQIQVLRGLFDSDGCAHKNGNVSFCSTSLEMVKQVRMMLLNFGIISALHHSMSYPTENSNANVACERWILEIDADADLFFEEIGFGLSRKQNRYRPKTRSLTDIIPFAAELAYKIASQKKWCKDKSVGKKRNQLKAYIKTKALKQKHKPLSYKNCQNILEWYSERNGLPEHRALQKLVDSNYKWVQAKEINTTVEHTWDFSFEQEDHSYISNGFISHNTPEGAGDLFHSMCMRAERGENKSYEFIKVHWSETDITEEMIDQAVEGLSGDSRAQEFEMEFLTAGDPVFNPVHLAACYKPVEDYPEVAQELEEYRKKVMKKDGHLYYFSGVDTAAGKLNKKDSRRDYHCFTTLTKSGIQAHTYYTKNESLLEWSGATDEVAGFGMVHTEGTVSKLHRQYPGFIQIEDNGPGQMTVSNHKLPDDSFSTLGIANTNIKTKSRYINQLVLAVETHSIIITDKFTYQCMLVYQRGTIPGSYQAPAGDHYDDPVMALAFAYDALLQHGALEFPWGQTADDLKRVSPASTDIERANLENMNYGPSVFKTNENNQRLSELFTGDGTYLDITSDLDISRIQEPDFIGRG